MSTNDLSGRFAEDPPGTPPSGSPGPSAPSSSSNILKIENFKNSKRNPENDTQKKRSTQKSDLSSEKLIELQSSDESDREITDAYGPVKSQPNLLSKSRTDAILGFFGFGKAKSRIDDSINSKSPENVTNLKENLFLEKLGSINSKPPENAPNFTENLFLEKFGSKNSIYDEKTSDEFVVEELKDNRPETFHTSIGNDKNFSANGTTTPKRHIPPDIDVYMEGERSRSRRQSRDFNYVPTPPPKKPINPRILILDFKEKNIDNIKLVRHTLITYTEIRQFSTKMLSRGGISILFGKPKARDFAETILSQKLSDLLRPRGGFLKHKKVFEVSCNVPKEINLAALNEHMKSISFKSIGFRTIFTFSTATQASKIIQDGHFFESYHLEFQPFVYKPKVACKCGSIHHSSCVPPPQTSDQESNICANCKGEHPTKTCDVLKLKMKNALENKKRSYAEALSAGFPKTSTPPSRPLNHPEINPSLIIDIVSVVLRHFNVNVDINEVKKVVSTAITGAQLIRQEETYPSQQPQDYKQNEPTPSEAHAQSKSKDFTTVVPKKSNKKSNKKKNTKPKEPQALHSNEPMTIEERVRGTLEEKENEEPRKSFPENGHVSTTDTTKDSDAQIDGPISDHSISPTQSDYDSDEYDRRQRMPSSSRRGRGGKQFTSKVQREFEDIEKGIIANPSTDISHVVLPYCCCGHRYEMKTSWKSHLFQGKKNEHNSHQVTCFCSKMSLNRDNYSKKVDSFHEHLIHSCVRQ
jgi:hypothetical protein